MHLKKYIAIFLISCLSLSFLAEIVNDFSNSPQVESAWENEEDGQEKNALDLFVSNTFVFAFNNKRSNGYEIKVSSESMESVFLKDVPTPPPES